ncbi:MAG: pyrroline-5-carboxylate reductase [Proteobacteria bacterium]|nr:pyrroline-5-carboxylate reductase [Pseudomonadota bacterium]MCL2306640.1 pyrroline-5-carboxylate reductase [Pseudomonadota bacterium]
MKYVFIGGGAMATALISGIVRSGKKVTDISVVDPDEAQRNRLTAAFPQVQCHSCIEKAFFEGVDVVVLAVKPQQLQRVARQLAPFTSAISVVLSVAAGVRVKDLTRWLGGYPAVIRAMPNTPAQVNAGTTGLYAAPGANEIARNHAHELLESVGHVFWVLREDSLDTVTAVSGGGPAYVFYFLEGLEAAALSVGLKKENARALALDTVSGAVALARHSNDSFAELRAKVTSKGGTTERAIQIFDQAKVSEMFQEAVQAARERAAELGDELGVDHPTDNPTDAAG